MNRSLNKSSSMVMNRSEDAFALADAVADSSTFAGGGSAAIPEGRNSRHIPCRDNMDMDIASYALADSSFADSSRDQSHFLDDSTHSTSLYRDALAEALLEKSQDGENVLRFANEGRRGVSLTSHQDGTPVNAAGGLSNAPTNIPMATQKKRSTRSTVKKITVSKPEKILDAPGLPTHDSKFLSWGENNCILIGLGSALYQYNWSTQQASAVETFNEEEVINHVTWSTHGCSVLNFMSGSTIVYDHNEGKMVRTVNPADNGTVSSLTMNGYLMTAATNKSGHVYVHDLRLKNSLINSFDGHDGPVHSLDYCHSEPKYLATGGVDGCVRVWDARKPDAPRYSMNNAHRKYVAAVRWSPEKRSVLITGGGDSTLNLFNTHKPLGDANDLRATEAQQYTELSVKTSAPITAILWPKDAKQIATAHSNGTISRRSVRNLTTNASFAQEHTSAGIACFDIAPNLETVCVAQHDEQLKFWKVFDPVSTSSSGRAPSATVGGPAAKAPMMRSASHDDLLDDELR